MDVDVIIIGTGFGADVAATRLLEKKPNATILLMERGVWWFTPERPLPDLLKNNPQKYPVQYWPRPDNSRGITDLLAVVKTNNDFIEGIRNFADGFVDLFSNRKRPRPLYRYNMFKDIDIVTASGVGGGSLIYSNVTIEPHYDAAANEYPVMKNWPLKLNKEDYVSNNPAKLTARKWMETKRGKLNKIVTKLPLPSELGLDPGALDSDHEFLYLGKSRALRDVANVNGADWKPSDNPKWSPLELQVVDYNTKNVPSESATQETYCERQGRCILGCLPGARHTINKTLLKEVLANHPNVSLENLANVQHIKLRNDGRYEVSYKNGQTGQDASHSARFVILAAGTLGSTEILLRSHEKGTLKLSNQRGRHFSTNGDFAGFVTNVHQAQTFTGKRYNIFSNRGPINTSHVMFTTNDGKIQINVEDGAIPSMLSAVTSAALKVLELNQSKFNFMNQLSGAWFTQRVPDFQDWFPIVPDPSKPERFQTESEMMAHTFFFNTMGTDDATGTFTLKSDGKLDLNFSDTPSNQRVYRVTEEIMSAMAQAMGGTYVPFPTWKGFQNHKLITVHPLGGSVMGHGPSEGVVNNKGQVFRVDGSGQQVYDGLYVMDGSIVPGPVAVNPTMTIVALALKIAEGVPI